jgi:HlyD family secretion protein
MTRVRPFILPAIAAAMFMYAALHVAHSQQTLDKPAPPQEPPRTPYARTVAGSGIVEAQSENISIGSALPGVVLEVYVPSSSVGKRVRAGEPLFRVDDRALKAQLKWHEAQLAAAQSQLDRLEALPRSEELPPSEAKVRAAQSNVSMLADQFQRSKELFGRNSVSEGSHREREFAYQVGQHQLAQAQAELALLQAGSWKPEKAVARAAVEQARAQAEQTRIDIDRALVRAPVDGDVLKVNVRPGEYVSTPPAQPPVVLGNLRALHVRVDIDENDIPRFRKEGAARAILRGAPRREFPLTFVRVEPFVIPKKSLTGDNTERVDTRVLQVIYALGDAHTEGEPPVFVGQQVDVFIDLGT